MLALRYCTSACPVRSPASALRPDGLRPSARADLALHDTTADDLGLDDDSDLASYLRSRSALQAGDVNYTGALDTVGVACAESRSLRPDRWDWWRYASTSF